MVKGEGARQPEESEGASLLHKGAETLRGAAGHRGRRIRRRKRRCGEPQGEDTRCRETSGELTWAVLGIKETREERAGVGQQTGACADEGCDEGWCSLQGGDE